MTVPLVLAVSRARSKMVEVEVEASMRYGVIIIRDIEPADGISRNTFWLVTRRGKISDKQ